MRTKTTFTILFWIENTRAVNDMARIYARITVNGKRVNISLKLKANIKTWSSTKRRAKGNSTEARQLNSYLDQVQNQLFQIYQDLKYKEKLVTALLIKANFMGDGEMVKL